MAFSELPVGWLRRRDRPGADSDTRPAALQRSCNHSHALCRSLWEHRGHSVPNATLLRGDERPPRSITDSHIVSLITRRSQVQILPGHSESPGQTPCRTWGCRVRATSLQPVATRRRWRLRRATSDQHGGLGRDEPAVTVGVVTPARAVAGHLCSGLFGCGPAGEQASSPHNSRPPSA